MVNRCDSVDALMYAYYEFMRKKEENQMLEKNKDYVEFSMWSYMATHKPGQCTDINITGISPEPGVLYMNNPFDIPCDVVVVPKRAFDRLQADNQHYRELAKQWEENYNLLLKKTGFTSVANLTDYICDPFMTSPEDKTLKEIIEECEEDYISERDKAEALQTENEQLKKKLHEFDPIPDFKELLKKLYSIEDTEALERALNHTCGGRGSVNGWIAVSLFWKQNYETLSKHVGFSSIEEIQDYLTNEAECDTLYDAIYLMHKEMDRRQKQINELRNEVKCISDKWASANSSNNSWKAAAECNSPKELIEKREVLEKEIEIYSRTLNEWKEGTGCQSPSAAKSLIESGASWHHAYRDAKKANEKLADEVKSWQEATGYETPEKATERLSKLRNERTHIVYLNDPLGAIAKWQKVTGFDEPKDFLKWKANIEGIMEAWKDETGCKYPGDARRLLEKWKTMTRSETPENAAKWLERFEETDKRCDKLAREVESWKNVTGYSTPEDYMHARISGAFHTPFDYTSAWQEVTGFSTPEKCSSYIDRLEKKLEDIKNLTEED